jgi:hypothetical protein
MAHRCPNGYRKSCEVDPESGHYYEGTDLHDQRQLRRGRCPPGTKICKSKKCCMLYVYDVVVRVVVFSLLSSLWV